MSCLKIVISLATVKPSNWDLNLKRKLMGLTKGVYWRHCATFHIIGFAFSWTSIKKMMTFVNRLSSRVYPLQPLNEAISFLDAFHLVFRDRFYHQTWSLSQKKQTKSFRLLIDDQYLYSYIKCTSFKGFCLL